MGELKSGMKNHGSNVKNGVGRSKLRYLRKPRNRSQPVGHTLNKQHGGGQREGVFPFKLRLLPSNN